MTMSHSLWAKYYLLKNDCTFALIMNVLLEWGHFVGIYNKQNIRNEHVYVRSSSMVHLNGALTLFSLLEPYGIPTMKVVLLCP